MSSPVDHVAAAIALLPSQYRDLPGIRSWVTAIANRLNEVDAALEQINTMTRLSVAMGAQLDGWGRILSTPRQGLNDTDYRFLLYARVAGFNSLGTIPEMEQLYANMMGVLAVVAYEPYVAEFWMEVTLPVPIGDLTLIAQAIKASKPAAVKLFLMEVTALPYFGFDEDTSPDAAGFTDSGGIVGGTFADTL